MKKRNKQILLFISAMIALTLSTESSAQAKPTDATCLPPSIVQNITISELGEYTAVPYADIIGWRYTSIDGKMYRRQYNYSKQTWIGEWELC